MSNLKLKSRFLYNEFINILDRHNIYYAVSPDLPEKVQFNLYVDYKITFTCEKIGDQIFFWNTASIIDFRSYYKLFYLTDKHPNIRTELEELKPFDLP